jgi:N-acetylneuraminic acid mutarotase
MKTRNGFIKNLRYICLIGVIALGLITIVGSSGGGGGDGADGSTTNNVPVADAGPDQDFSTGSLVTLDGSGSSDADGDTLTYSWSITSAPEGSTAALSDAAIVNPTFTPDVAGEYTIQLVVNDGTEDSDADTVLVTVNRDYNSGSWTQYNTEGDKPSARCYHGMAYLSPNKILLFGGWESINSNEGLLNDTWEYDVENHTWNEISISGDIPPARYRHNNGMAYLGNNLVLLYGGAGEDSTLGDTWIYNGNNQTWTLIDNLSINPSSRDEHAMSYIGNSKVILFGSGTAEGNLLNDTWEFDASTNSWTQLNITGDLPEGRKANGLAYIGNNTILLFGGMDDSDNDFNDTWIFNYNDLTWTEVTYLETEAHEGTMAYIGDEKVLMFGDGETYLYDNENQSWTQLSFSDENCPNYHQENSMAFTGNSSIIMFGGHTIEDDEEVLSDQTWEFKADNNLEDLMTNE